MIQLLIFQILKQNNSHLLLIEIFQNLVFKLTMLKAFFSFDKITLANRKLFTVYGLQVESLGSLCVFYSGRNVASA